MSNSSVSKAIQKYRFTKIQRSQFAPFQYVRDDELRPERRQVGQYALPVLVEALREEDAQGDGADGLDEGGHVAVGQAEVRGGLGGPLGVVALQVDLGGSN